MFLMKRIKLCFLMMCISVSMISAASAETIVRHERTVHGNYPSAADEVEDDVITVYGPYAAMSTGQKEAAVQQEPDGQADSELAEEETARARLERFLGQEPQDTDLWLQEGIEEGLPYRDCVYMQGGSRGQEDYVIAIRRQGNPEPLAPDLYSLVILIGRGQLGQKVLETEKLPILELETGGQVRDITFTESRVRLPVAFMLRMESEGVREAATADKGMLCLSTSAGDCVLELPREVRNAWLKVLD